MTGHQRRRRRILARLLRVDRALVRLELDRSAQPLPAPDRTVVDKPRPTRRSLELRRDALQDELLELHARQSRELSGQQMDQQFAEIWETLSDAERASLRRSDAQLRATRARLIDEEWRED